MRFLWLLLCLLLLPGMARAQEPESSPSPPTVTKIRFQTLSDATDPADFSAQPKTLYRSGDHYGRLEEAFDKVNRMQRLILVNQRDTWLINLADKTGRHTREATHDFHLPVVADRADLPSGLSSLEYGAEKAFFQHSQARTGTDEVEGVRYRVYDLTEGPYRLKLYCQLESGVPALLDVQHNGRRAFLIRYLNYEADLPFDASLFQPPSGVKFLAPGS